MGLLVGAFALPGQAQSTSSKRRETNANRVARIARITAATYAYKWELAGGGGYERERSGQYLQQTSEVTFFGTAMRSLTPRFGIIGDVSGAYGNAKIGNNPYLNSVSGKAYLPQISEYEFTAGPSYRLLAKQKFAITGFVTGGLGLGKFDSGSKGFSSSELGLYQSGYNAAFTAGANIDYNFYPNFAFRATPKLIGNTFSDQFQANKGLSFGLVYRFGK